MIVLFFFFFLFRPVRLTPIVRVWHAFYLLKKKQLSTQSLYLYSYLFRMQYLSNPNNIFISSYTPNLYSTNFFTTTGTKLFRECSLTLNVTIKMRCGIWGTKPFGICCYWKVLSFSIAPLRLGPHHTTLSDYFSITTCHLCDMLTCFNPYLQGQFTRKFLILSSVTHPHVVPNP